MMGIIIKLVIPGVFSFFCRIVNNMEWYGGKSVVQFLSTVGRHFRMGPMLAEHRSVSDCPGRSLGQLLFDRTDSPGRSLGQLLFDRTDCPGRSLGQLLFNRTDCPSRSLGQILFNRTGLLKTCFCQNIKGFK